MNSESRFTYEILIAKLDQFIRKYYLNQLLKGTLYSTALILILFLSINALEYYFYFPTQVRKVLFLSFLGISGISLFKWVVVPAAKYFRLGALISHEQAAVIIGNHFQHVGDKLLNILQLRQLADQVENPDLILAGIDQKASEIRLVPFKSAINLTQNRKYLRYALPPLLLLLILLFAAPSLLMDSTQRLIYNGREFIKPAPFQFLLENETLEVVQNSDFVLFVRVNGNQLPEEAFIVIDGFPYRLKKEAPDFFSYRFNNVSRSTRFRITGAEVQSPTFTLNVLSKPTIQGFEIKLDYPSYTGRKDETIENTGDLVVPQGTIIDWIFDANHTDHISFYFENENKKSETKRFSDFLFTLKKRVLKDDMYQVFFSNQALPKGDSVRYSLNVIPDKYPEITAEKFVDSSAGKLIFLAGDASDDYGIEKIMFHYSLFRGDKKVTEIDQIIKQNAASPVAFRHSFDLNTLEIQPGDKVEYYLEVFDNDAVNGSKSTKSAAWTFDMPTLDEFKKMEDFNEDLIQKNMLQAAKESKKLQEQLQKMREKLLQQKDMDWQTRKELQRILDQQKALEKLVEEAKKAMEENKKNQEEFSEKNEEVKQKQEKLEELMEQVVQDEMKSLMEKIQELMQELNKDEALKMMEQMEMNDSKMNKQMDRMLELFKQLEIEKEVTETVKELERLSDKQEELKKETDAGQNNPQQSAPEKQKENQDKLIEKQKDLQEDFKKIEEKLNEIAKKNAALEKPQKMDDKKEDAKDIQRDMKDSQQNLEQKKNDKASKNQKDAAKKMKDMANQMQSQMQAGQMQQMQMDMRTLRQLLENLVALSFSQEDLIHDFNKTDPATPRFVQLTQKQNKLKDDFKIAEDTLQALAKRMIQLESFVTDKVLEINRSLKESIIQLEERKKTTAADFQQRAMKNLNDLALMLSESLSQLQQQMASKMKGQQMCADPNSPGQGEPKDRMSEGQEQLNEQMKGKQKEGKSPGAREFAEMAAKQAALRKALEAKQRKLQQQGKGSNKEIQEMVEEMNKSEIDLVNKRLNGELLKRQQQILTRMLEFEKAERLQEQDEKRKSEIAKNTPKPMPPALEEYIRQRKAEIQTYQSVSPTLKPYYRNLVENYLKYYKPIN
jgi:hypothetical protein